MSERVFTRITRSLVAGSPERGQAPTLDGAGPNAEEVALAVQTISPRQHQSKHEPNEAKRPRRTAGCSVRRGVCARRCCVWQGDGIRQLDRISVSRGLTHWQGRLTHVAAQLLR